MTGHELMDFGALLCGLLTATGVLGICLIFGLYQLEDRLGDDEPTPDPTRDHTGAAS